MTSKIQASAEVDAKDLERRVKKMYKDVAEHPEVTYHFEMGRALAERLGYPADHLNRIPKESIDSFAGVGYYFDLAKIQPGETILDMGSGSGMDVFFAANQTGKQGKVIGIDMTIEQLLKSETLRQKGNYPQVKFMEGYIERLPVDFASVDVVISNGVINLSSAKENVFKEAGRVLKSGGRLAIADIVTSVQLPENISCDATLWAACIGGAMQIDSYRQLIENAGFAIEVERDNPYAFLSKGAKGATEEFGIKSVSILAVKK